MAAYGAGDAASTGDDGYVFDNAAQPAHQRFAGLPAVFDPGTLRHLSERGIGPSWHCLEVGAGSGSVAVWLAERVGSGGHVLATDIDTRFLNDLAAPNLEIRRHDIAKDPLPENAFDLIHARLVLVHVPERNVALWRMARALKPGGWLVVEEFGAPTIQREPGLNPAEIPLKVHDVMMRVMAERGLDLHYGRRVPALLRARGLVEIGAEGRVLYFSGGSPGAHVLRANFEQLRGPILATGLIDEPEFNQELARLEDPEVAQPSQLLWAAWGRRPANRPRS